jgi:hypothetical protein
MQLKPVASVPRLAKEAIAFALSWFQRKNDPLRWSCGMATWSWRRPLAQTENSLIVNLFRASIRRSVL